jgi:hypothetical protein
MHEVYFSFKCKKCSTVNKISFEIKWECTSKTERDWGMGTDTYYKAGWEGNCCNCHEPIKITWRCWEFPKGSFEYDKPESDHAEDIKKIDRD